MVAGTVGTANVAINACMLETVGNVSSPLQTFQTLNFEASRGDFDKPPALARPTAAGRR